MAGRGEPDDSWNCIGDLHLRGHLSRGPRHPPLFRDVGTTFEAEGPKENKGTSELRRKRMLASLGRGGQRFTSSEGREAAGRVHHGASRASLPSLAYMWYARGRHFFLQYVDRFFHLAKREADACCSWMEIPSPLVRFSSRDAVFPLVPRTPTHEKHISPLQYNIFPAFTLQPSEYHDTAAAQ